MKHLLVLLGVAASFACPLRSSAAPSVIVVQGHAPQWLVRTKVFGKGPNRTTYYYTNITLTGSNLPVVLREYQGEVQIVSGAPVNGRLYGIGDLKSTGFTGVTAVAQLDPAITVHSF